MTLLSTIDELENSVHTGIFKVLPGMEIYGHLKLAGPATNLYLWSRKPFDLSADPIASMRGVLHDLTKVSLINCLTAGPGARRSSTETINFADVFPHFVALGDDHISPQERRITDMHVAVDDAPTLFYDFDAYGHVPDATSLIQAVLEAYGPTRKVEIGPHPQIAYFTGKTQILETDTALGTISAAHTPSWNIGGIKGVRIDNMILVNIHVEEAVDFEDAMDRVATVVRFLEMMVGRRQNILRLTFRIKSDTSDRAFVRVYWSLRSRRQDSDEDRGPHPTDVLLNGGIEPATFAPVMSQWLDRERAWRDARWRFSSSFDKGRSYDIDRLVSAANMFDILPESAVPDSAAVSNALQSATEECRAIFKKLPPSDERDSVLNELGRVGKSRLKHKIRYRAEHLIDVIGNEFPELSMVLNQAVDCRNHYVHGGAAKINYDGNSTMIFFTDALEFVFAASDLIEAGWDIRAWIARGKAPSHPFGKFRVTYAERLEELQQLLSEARRAGRRRRSAGS